MEPILSNVAAKAAPRSEPRDLLCQLYREIGISAVAAALEVSGDALEARATPKEKRSAILGRKAA